MIKSNKVLGKARTLPLALVQGAHEIGAPIAMLYGARILRFVRDLERSPLERLQKKASQLATLLVSSIGDPALTSVNTSTTSSSSNSSSILSPSP